MKKVLTWDLINFFDGRICQPIHFAAHRCIIFALDCPIQWRIQTTAGSGRSLEPPSPPPYPMKLK